MKNRFRNYLTVVALIFTFLAVAQAPQKMSYQSVIRNNAGDLVANSPIGLRISILKDSPTGTVVYSETMTNTTNENGLLSIEIGGGTPITGTFAGIDWSTGTFFIKTETDPNGGSNYDVVGTSQLLSVPYALYAEKTRNMGKTTIIISSESNDEEAAAQLAEEAGPNTEKIILQENPFITTLDLSSIKTLLYIDISSNTALTNVNLGNLTKVYENLFIVNNPQLININFDSLTFCNGTFLIAGNASPNLNFPLLSKIGFEANSIFQITGMPNLQTINLQQLQAIKGGFYIGQNSTLSTIELPTLTSTGSDSAIDLSNNPILTSVSLALLQFNKTSLKIADNPLLTSISLANQTSTVVNNVSFGYDFSGNALPSIQVNTILNKFIPFEPPTSITQIKLNQNPPAPPTGQGIIDKQTLINNGFNVITD